jgi:hypothetical protein
MTAAERISFFLNVSLRFSGGYGEGETPVPIPNTAVKPLSVDGTARESGWESRTPPGVISRPSVF